MEVQWGDLTGVVVTPIDTTKDVVRRHEPEGNQDYSMIANAGAASTTKKIVEKSVTSRKKMAGFDDVI